MEAVSARGWPPLVCEQLGDWRLHASRGYSGRGNACWPIGAPDRPLDDAIEAVEAWYRARSLPPLFRPADLPATEALRERLAARAYGPRTETLVMTGGLVADEAGGVILADAPDSAFAEVFLSTAADPEDAAERVEAVRRLAAPRAFARLEIEGEAVAIGAAAVDSGWAGIFGMRTLAQHRRKGLARRIIAGLSAFAAEAGARRIYLQVEASNTPAIALYEGLGFATGYRYRYWTRG
ncbi:GNAT family N-acetyltransferase [Phenylobacterium montanum]|uniref:GNAT family N-acetyltransferase n=1 Tax=Phenylobacterium montanum TaxID=2823693 RepID=A0A975G560_9CAUL|nr:GNAT family N-acetyltransferase [Caulobacter sp. S6]